MPKPNKKAPNPLGRVRRGGYRSDEDRSANPEAMDNLPGGSQLTGKNRLFELLAKHQKTLEICDQKPEITWPWAIFVTWVKRKKNYCLKSFEDRFSWRERDT